MHADVFFITESDQDAVSQEAIECPDALIYKADVREKINELSIYANRGPCREER